MSCRLPSDKLSLSPGDAGHSPHDFVDVSGAVVEVVADSGVLEDLSDVFHGVRTIISWQRSGLADWVDVADVS